MNSAQPPSTFPKITRAWFLASALYDGVEDGDLKQIKTLLEEKCADPNMLLPEYGISPFHLIVGNSCKAFALKATRLCLLSGADPNVRSEEGLTPVHVTAIWGRVEVLELLLKNGGDPWLVDYEQKKNAFQYAQEENQWGTFNLMATYCGLDKSIDPQQEVLSSSPCTLELKRVLVYKNDLCIEYEALSKDDRQANVKAISVQTTPRSSKCKSISVQTTPPSELQLQNTQQTSRNQESGTPNLEFDWIENQNGACLNDKVIQIIKGHRNQTVIYESVRPEHISLPKQEIKFDHCTLKRNSLYSKTDLQLNLVTDLKSKLDNTNKLRLVYEETDIKNNPKFKNITQRKSKNHKQVSAEPVNSFGDVEEDYDMLDKNSDTRDIGFVTDKEFNRECATSDIGSGSDPPDIGFKVRSSDEMNLGFIQDQSNLISDISSVIDIETVPQIVEDNIMTEEEYQEKIYVSSSTSNPYITCDEDQSPQITDSDTSFIMNSKTELNVNSDNDNLQRPAISTPNILNEQPQEDSCCSTNAVSGSPCGELGKEYEQQLNSKKWVEAHIPYSSDEEELEMSISEEYKYTDAEEGIVLIEKRYICNDISNSIAAGDKATASKSNKQNQQTTSEDSDISTLSRSTAAYDTDALRKDLCEKGLNSGPITGSTKRVYLRRLKRFRRKLPPTPEVNIPSYSCELSRTLTTINLNQLLTDWHHLEQDMSSVFESVNPSAKWREGFAKTSFTYLLLDPRLTHNLPARAATAPPNEVWSDFLKSIFYIGKGKRSRPYNHLYQAVNVWNGTKEDNSKKVERILEIWRSGLGVVCLHVFQNTIPVEAYTREAAMISALSVARLTNQKTGEFYGPAASWLERQKRQLGVILLHRAYQVFLAEGERQLRPGDID